MPCSQQQQWWGNGTMRYIYRLKCKYVGLTGLISWRGAAQQNFFITVTVVKIKQHLTHVSLKATKSSVTMSARHCVGVPNLGTLSITFP